MDNFCSAVWAAVTDLHENSSKHFISGTEGRHTCFEMTWEWVNYGRTHIFRSTIPLTQNCSTARRKSDLTVGTSTYCSTAVKQRMAYITGRWKKRGGNPYTSTTVTTHLQYCRIKTTSCSLHSIVSWISHVDEQQCSWLSYIKDDILSTKQRQIKLKRIGGFFIKTFTFDSRAQGYQ